MQRKTTYCNIQLQEGIKTPLIEYCARHDLKLSFVCGLLIKEFFSGSFDDISTVYIPKPSK